MNIPVDCHLRWVGAAEGVAFLDAHHDVARIGPSDPESSRFHRLDLESMKWLEPFKLPEPSIDRSRGNVAHSGGNAMQKPQRHVLPNHLLVTPKGIVVLCEETIEQQDAFAPEIMQYDSVGYHVSC